MGPSASAYISERLKMPLKIVRNNIVNVKADAIVNTANPEPIVGIGVDSAIYTAAGWDRLLEEREKIGPMKPGQAAHTPAFGLDAKYIIHVIGPVWQGGNCGERETVADCYRKAMEMAEELECSSIAFPLIATGTYGFPKDEALKIAMREISSFLIDHEMDVIIVVFDKLAFEISGKLFENINEYIDDHDANLIRGEQVRDFFDGAFGDGDPEIKYGEAVPRFRRERAAALSQMHSVGALQEKESAWMPPEEIDASVTIDEMLKDPGKSFQEKLFDLIEERGLEDPDVYKRANIDRKLFSKIRNPGYNPSKRTAVALAIALKLDLDETNDLLMRAGFALSESTVFDLLISYCIEHKIYDVHEVNCILFKYDQAILGG